VWRRARTPLANPGLRSRKFVFARGGNGQESRKALAQNQKGKSPNESIGGPKRPENRSGKLLEPLRSERNFQEVSDLISACCLRTQQGVWMVSVRADRELAGLGAGGFWLVLFLTVFSLGHLLGAP
jgi:hypothetical protein